MNFPSTNAHILVVDDISATYKMAGKVLSNRGYRVSFARSGEEALEQLPSDPPDLILLDIMMPGMGGYETCKQLKNDPRYQNIPVIFLTGKEETNDILAAFKVGGADFINKPFVPSILLARVETHLTLSFAHQREMQTKQRLENIINSMEQGLVVVDHDGKIVQSNRKLEQLTGLDAETLHGKPLDTLFADQSNHDTAATEQQLKQQNGPPIPVRTLAASLDNRDQDENECQVLLIDDLREMLNLESLRQANQAKDNFLASMSHELHTPLATIIGNSMLLQEQSQQDESLKLLQSIEAAGRNQQRMIRDILEVSKIEGGEITLNQQPYDLVELVEACRAQFAPTAADAGLLFNVIFKEPPDYQPVGDSLQIRQVLDNLICNAIKFTPKGAVTFTVWHSEQLLHFKVEDTGIGIKAEIAETLVQRFEHANSSISRQFGGSGLGLYIADNLALAMGGKIHLSSEEGKGSTFQLDLPYQASTLPHEEESRSSTEAPQPSRFRGKVLIAEDTPEMWMLVEGLLQPMGISTKVAKNGQEALEYALAEPFDLILMDMQMPMMDGIEATSILRQLGYNKPISALTANIMPQHRAQFEAAGCDAFLTKPIDRQALVEVLERFLEQGEESSLEQSNSMEEMISDELRLIFIDRLGSMRQTLQSALRYEQWDEVRTVAHNLKGTGTTFGYPQLTELGKRICDAIDHEQIQRVPELAEEMLEKMNLS